MGQIIAVDYGTKFIGLAISDETKLIATTLPALRVPHGRAPIAAFLKEVAKHQLEGVVIGLPTGLGNKPTRVSKEVETFATELTARTQLPVSFWNETYTSQQAEAFKLKKGSNDSHSHAARIILQEYLDHLNSGI